MLLSDCRFPGWLATPNWKSEKLFHQVLKLYPDITCVEFDARDDIQVHRICNARPLKALCRAMLGCKAKVDAAEVMI